MNNQTDEQRRIEWLEQRVQVLYAESARLNIDGTKEYARDINGIARDLEVYVDSLKRKVSV